MIFLQDEKGQNVMEYALIAALLVVVAIAAMRALGLDIAGLFQSLADAF